MLTTENTPSIHIAQLPVDRKHDWQRMCKVRGDLTQIATLRKCLLHHAILLKVEAENCLLKVTNSAVDQLGAATACARRKIKFLH